MPSSTRQIFQPLPAAFKKSGSSADRAAVGARTVKSGQSRWFIGYRKHTLRLWLPNRADAILLVPLMTWVAPANRGDVLFLEPSLRYCLRRFDFVPDLVVGDQAYINLEIQRRLREKLGVGVVTQLRKDLDVAKELEPALTSRCPQGQPLEWLGLHEQEGLHWFAVRDNNPLCSWCWCQSRCPREFSFAAAAHEILLGTVPINSKVGQRLFRQARKWIEATQSFDKNRLGLSQMFLNSLRLTWRVSLLADTVSLLRAHALLRRPPEVDLLSGLRPNQLNLEL